MANLTSGQSHILKTIKWITASTLLAVWAKNLWSSAGSVGPFPKGTPNDFDAFVGMVHHMKWLRVPKDLALVKNELVGGWFQPLWKKYESITWDDTEKQNWCSKAPTSIELTWRWNGKLMKRALSIALFHCQIVILWFLILSWIHNNSALINWNSARHMPRSPPNHLSLFWWNLKFRSWNVTKTTGWWARATPLKNMSQVGWWDSQY